MKLAILIVLLSFLANCLEGQTGCKYNGEVNKENNYKLPQHLYVADINKKTNTFLFDITPDNIRTGKLDRDVNTKITNGRLILVDNSDFSLMYTNINTKNNVCRCF